MRSVIGKASMKGHISDMENQILLVVWFQLIHSCNLWITG